jgi:hypothetical protein
MVMSVPSSKPEVRMLLREIHPSGWNKADLSGVEDRLNREALPRNWKVALPPNPSEDPNKALGDT